MWQSSSDVTKPGLEPSPKTPTAVDIQNTYNNNNQNHHSIYKDIKSKFFLNDKKDRFQLSEEKSLYGHSFNDFENITPLNNINTAENSNRDLKYHSHYNFKMVGSQSQQQHSKHHQSHVLSHKQQQLQSTPNQTQNSQLSLRCVPRAIIGDEKSKNKNLQSSSSSEDFCSALLSAELLTKQLSSASSNYRDSPTCTPDDFDKLQQLPLFSPKCSSSISKSLKNDSSNSLFSNLINAPPNTTVSSLSEKNIYEKYNSGEKYYKFIYPKELLAETAEEGSCSSKAMPQPGIFHLLMSLLTYCLFITFTLKIGKKINY